MHKKKLILKKKKSVSVLVEIKMKLKNEKTTKKNFNQYLDFFNINKFSITT